MRFYIDPNQHKYGYDIPFYKFPQLALSLSIPSLIENINFYLENNGIFGENLQTIDFAGECARKNADTFAGYVLSV